MAMAKPKRRAATPLRKGAARKSGARKNGPRKALPDARSALLDAATALFASHGFSGVSVRDIATKAKVNHGLVHRHFGSKEALLRAVMQRQADEMAAAAGESIALRDSNKALTERVFAVALKRDAYWRILARALLDGADPRDLQLDFPTFRRLIENRQTLGQSREAAAVDTVVQTAASLGFLVFEPFLRAASGLDKGSKEALRQAFVRRLAELTEQ